MAPPLPAGALSPPIGVLAKPAKLKALDLSQLHHNPLGEPFTQVTDAGCSALAAALESGTLPALERLYLYGTPASEAAKHALMARLPARTLYPTATRTRSSAPAAATAAAAAVSARHHVACNSPCALF